MTCNYKRIIKQPGNSATVLIQPTHQNFHRAACVYPSNLPHTLCRVRQDKRPIIRLPTDEPIIMHIQSPSRPPRARALSSSFTFQAARRGASATDEARFFFGHKEHPPATCTLRTAHKVGAGHENFYFASFVHARAVLTRCCCCCRAVNILRNESLNIYNIT